MKIYLLCIAQVFGQLYRFGRRVKDSSWGSAGKKHTKVRMNQKAEFLGMQTDSFWLLANGALSLEPADLTYDPDDITNNIIFGMMWGSNTNTYPSNVKAYYRVEHNPQSTAGLQINSHINFWSPTFRLKSATVFTMKNVVNPLNTSQKNFFQFVIAYGRSGNKMETHIIWHFHKMKWVPENPEFGVFVGLKENEKCFVRLRDENGNFVENMTPNKLVMGSNIAKGKEFRGRWRLSFEDDLRCDAGHFETACPEPQAGNNADFLGMVALDTDPAKWLFYAHHQCIPDHGISKNETYITAACEYDADYYDSRWSIDPPTCTDFSAVKTFDVTIDVTLNDTNSRDNEGQATSTINTLADLAGIDKGQIGDIQINGGEARVDDFGNEEETQPLIEFEITLPLAVKDKVKQEDLEENLKDIVGAIPHEGGIGLHHNSMKVFETTAECLTACLGCKGRCDANPPPIPYDACCGGCPNGNPSKGKPYSTIIQACCTNGYEGEIYDPDQFVCCRGELMPKVEWKQVLFMDNTRC